MIKRLLFRIIAVLVLSAAVFVACNKEGMLPSASKEPLSVRRPNSITMDDIQTYLSVYKKVGQTKGNDVRVEPVLSDLDTVLYLINYADGWELLSADRRAPRVFAMTDKGHLSMEDLLTAPDGVKALYNDFVEKVKDLKRNPEWQNENDYLEDWETVLPDRDNGGWILVNSVVLDSLEEVQNHLTVTKWGQSYPWNIRAPYTNNSLSTHCLTGCMPVAGAQMLYYLHDNLGVPSQAYGESSTQAYVPTISDTLILQASDVSFDSSTYSSSVWDTMPLSSSGTGSFAAVSTLMVQIGLYIGAKYYIGGTLGYMTPLENAFVNQFSIQCTGTESVNTETLTSEIIDNEMPVILGISQHDGFGHRLFGHAVVADAAKRIHVTRQNSYICRLEDENGIMTIYHKTETIHELTPTYLGMNWGANGSFMYSGGNPIWFSVDTLSWTTGSYTWDTIEYMIYDFHV